MNRSPGLAISRVYFISILFRISCFQYILSECCVGIDNLYSVWVILQILFPYFWKVYTEFHLIAAKITGEGGTIDWGHRADTGTLSRTILHKNWKIYYWWMFLVAAFSEWHGGWISLLQTPELFYRFSDCLMIGFIVLS